MWWRTEARHGARGRGLTQAHAVVALCATAALGVTLALPARAAPAVPAADGTPAPYAFAPDAGTVPGATGTTDAARLDPGHTYRSTLPAAGKLYYRLDLDATTNAYVSATAVPRAGARVSASDGVRVTVQDADGATCSSGTTHFGPTQSPHPVAAWAARETGPGSYGCRDAGVYYAVVERRDLSGSATGAWDLELDYVTEPSLRRPGATTTTPPGAWNSATPDALLGDPVRRAGGAGFATASPLGQGVWQDAIRPGQTLFYKVPVDWGRQLAATAELGSSPGGSPGDGYVGTALAMTLYNPVRGHVDDATTGYSGAQTSAALTPLPPVAYANRHAAGDRTSAMRFAGWYYLAVHLAAPVAQRFGNGPFGLTLRVRVSGTATSPPAYAGWSAPRDVFRVTAADREETAMGTIGGGGGAGTAASGGDRRSRTMEVVAVGGIGTGTALVLVLGVWTAAARRRARSRWAG
ncbi:hypothetical protein [Streptomyces sp. Ru72]|uniref:hypothetical protein n=1 Tax=Streptomyces sp. Ru72 TaxID=2080747 RepID=UPI0021561C7C|nr:hypothetical protein [Streptomyces sp. Ru72]